MHRTYYKTYVFNWLYFTQCITSFSSIDYLHHLCTHLFTLFHLKLVQFSWSTHLLMSLSLGTCQIGLSDRLVILVKGFLKLPNLHKLLKQKSQPLSKNLALMTFGKLLTVFSTKVNLLYLLYSMALRCCLLHLIKQNYLLKTFLKTLTLMTGLSLYLFSFLELIWNCIYYFCKSQDG